MKVKEITSILNQMNPEANFVLTTNGKANDNWEINFGGSEGVTKKTAEMVTIDVEPRTENSN